MHEGPGPANDRIVAEEEFNLSGENVESLLTVCVDMRRRLPGPRRKRAFHQRKGSVSARTGRLEEHGASSSAKHFAFAGLEDNRFISHIHLYFPELTFSSRRAVPFSHSITCSPSPAGPL